MGEFFMLHIGGVHKHVYVMLNIVLMCQLLSVWSGHVNMAWWLVHEQHKAKNFMLEHMEESDMLQYLCDVLLLKLGGKDLS